MRWYSEICCRAPAPLRVASLHFNLLLKPCAAVTAKHFTACLDVGNTLALSRGQCNANGSRFIILFIIPDMNHALCAVPPPKELVKSCEAALFLIHFLRLIYLCLFLRLFFNPQIYCHQHRAAKNILFYKQD